MQFSVERHLPQNFAAVSLESRAEVVNVDTTQLGHQPVGAARWKAAQPEIVDAILAPAADDVIALGNFFEEQRNICGIVLQVAIHGDDVLAAGVIESGGKAGSLPKIAAQFNHSHAAVNGGNLTQQRKRSVDGAVIHQHHLEG